MRGDTVVERQRLMSQAVFALADHITQSTGYALTPVTVANLPSSPTTGMIACISDSTVNTWGSAILGGGSHTVLAFYNGAGWTVAGA